MPRQKKQRLKRRKDGRYCCKADGIQFMAWSEDEALDAREKYLELKKQGVTNSSTPLLTYADNWISTHKAGVKKTTYNADIVRCQGQHFPAPQAAVQHDHGRHLHPVRRIFDKLYLFLRQGAVRSFRAFGRLDRLGMDRITQKVT